MKNYIKNLLILIAVSLSFLACSSDNGNDAEPTQLEEHSYEFYITEGVFAGKSFVGTLENDKLLPLYQKFTDQNKEKFSIDFNGANNFNTYINVITENNQVLPLGVSQTNLENSFVNISFLDNGTYPLFRSESGTAEIDNVEVYTTALGNQTASYTLIFEGFFRQINFLGNTEDAPIIKVNGKIIIKKSVI